MLNEGEKEDGLVIDPYNLQTGGKEVNYEKLIKYFGCSAITEELVTRVEAATKRKAH